MTTTDGNHGPHMQELVRMKGAFLVAQRRRRERAATRRPTRLAAVERATQFVGQRTE